MLPCSNKQLFGLECMGCGIQRAIKLILEGKFVEAFYMYPAIYPIIFLLLIIFLNFIDKKRSYSKIFIFTPLSFLIEQGNTDINRQSLLRSCQ